MNRLLTFIILALLSPASNAEALSPDGWNDARNRQFLKWVYAAADASRPCSLKAFLPPNGVQLQSEVCVVTREAGSPVQRKRKLKLKVTGARWSGYEIQEIAYEQQYSIQEQLVYHASMEFKIAGPTETVSEKLRDQWKKRGVQYSRDTERSRDLVEREAGIEWIKRLAKVTVFATEFYE